MPPHDLQHEDPRRGLRHRRHVERGLAHRGRDVFRDRPEARTAIGDRQIVVDGLRHVHRNQRIAHAFRELRHLETGIGRVVAAVVEKVADVVRAEDFDQPFVLGAILVEARELIAAGAERARGRVLESGDRAGRLASRVDQVLRQRADDAVAAGIKASDLRCVIAGGFDDCAGRRVEHGGHTAGLGIERVAFGHFGSRSGHGRRGL